MKIIFEKRKNSFLPLWAFLLTSGLLCLVYACFGLFPFGGKTLAWGDMKQQVIPLLLEFKDILAGKSGFLLNFQNAGGMSFWGVFFFFLSSPFTFLITFVKKSSVYFFVNLLVLLKLSLASAAASCFFRAEYPKLDGKLSLFFSLSYGLCGYGLLYYQNLVWLDVLILFPFVILGFLRLVNQGKCMLFTVSLIALISVNYYLSYMALLGLLLLSALFLKYCVPKGKRGEIAGRIGLSVVLALLVTAVVWLPSLLQCLRSARTAQSLVDSLQSGGFFTELSTTLPVLLCTAGAFSFPALAPLFPSSPKRKALLCSFFLTTLPTVIEPVNKLWHTGSYQAFPVRYGYIPLFLALWCAADFLEEEGRWRSPDRPFRFRLKSGEVLLIVLYSCLFLLGGSILILNFERISSYTSTLWFNRESFFFLALFALAAAALVWLAVMMWRKGNVSKALLGWVLLGTVLLQGGYHGAVLIGSAANSPESGRKVLEIEGSLPDTGLYRVKQDEKFCDVNLLGAGGFLSFNHYTSLTDEAFLHAIKKLGYSSYWMETSACCGTDLSDMLLSNKYVLTRDLKWEKTGGKNLGYLLPAGALPETLDAANRFELQNSLFLQILSACGKAGKEKAFQRYEPSQQPGILLEDSQNTVRLQKTSEIGSLLYQIPINGQETLYFDAFCENTNHLREPCYHAFRITVNGETIAESYPSQNKNGIIKLGDFEHETVNIRIEMKKEQATLRSFGVWGLGAEKKENLAECLSSRDLSLQKSEISGTVVAQGPGQSLFLSIPYTPGMRVSVNGKQAKFHIVLDCFLEIPLAQGKNEIRLSCIPQGVRAGVILSFAGITGCLAILLARRFHWGRKALLCWNKAAYPLLMAAFYGAMLLIYLLPVLIWSGKFLI